MKNIVMGLYPNRVALEHAVEHIKASNFKPEDISVVMSKSTGAIEEREAVAHNTLDAAAVGGGTGAVIGGTLGFLAAAGMLAIPGIGALVVLGTLGTTLLGSAAAGGIGALIGSFVGLDGSADEMKVYEERLRKGAALLSVHCHDQNEIDAARNVMAQTGAEKIFPELKKA